MSYSEAPLLAIAAAALARNDKRPPAKADSFLIWGVVAFAAPLFLLMLWSAACRAVDQVRVYETPVTVETWGVATVGGKSKREEVFVTVRAGNGVFSDEPTGFSQADCRDLRIGRVMPLRVTYHANKLAGDSWTTLLLANACRG